jgi:1-deoxy-D-xylulose-5-phosphate synthase
MLPNNLYLEIKNMDTKELSYLAKTVRREIINSVSKTGGHLAPSLGTVELTLALYKVFDFPKDKLIWDVGHQAYAHKIISDRADKFHTIRQKGGISGFTKRSESEFDPFGAGHTSTSIAASMGILKAKDYLKKNFNVLAVIGDGAMTSGMALEALNQVSEQNLKLKIILNDNSMSIAKNVGALSKYLNDIRVSNFYKNLKSIIPNNFLRSKISDLLMAVKEYFYKNTGMFFENMGFSYIGPMDGHDIESMVNIFTKIKNYDKPMLIHVKTVKGKGYYFAENNPEKYHGVGIFDVDTGEVKANSKRLRSYSSVLGETLTKLADIDDKIIAITAAMPKGTGLDVFGEKFPDRLIDLGIAEQTATTFAGGLATQGLKPVFAVYSTFLQRAFDQLIHDIALQNLSVLFAIDRAGIVGRDGPTHHGVFDISYLRLIPNMKIFAPSSLKEFIQMLKYFLKDSNMNGPVSIRYPRLSEPLFEDIEISKIPNLNPYKWEIIHNGDSNLAVLFVGPFRRSLLHIVQDLEIHNSSITLVNCRAIKPMDTKTLDYILRNNKKIITIEENSLIGGFGSSILEYISDKEISDVRVKRLGIKDKWVSFGSRIELIADEFLDKESILKEIKTFLEVKNSASF